MDTRPELHVVLGSGPLGLATARALLGRGHRVRLVNRSGRAAATPAGAEVVAADAYDPAAVRAQATGATAVYQCAQPPYHQWAERFPPLQASIIEGVAPTGARLVVAENLYMYGPVAGPMTEDLPYRATTRKGAMRARMAEAVLAAHHAGRLPTTSGRGSDFFGPGVLDSALGERVFAPALAGKTAQGIGDLDQPHTFTFINDFGEALAILGEHEAALGRAWHVPNAAPLTQRRVIALIFETLGAQPRMSGMGRLMMMLGGLFIVGAREMVEMMYEFEQPFVVDSGAFTRAFGQQATPLPEAIRQTVAWYRAHQGQPQPAPAVTGR